MSCSESVTCLLLSVVNSSLDCAEHAAFVSLCSIGLHYCITHLAIYRNALLQEDLAKFLKVR